MKIRTIYQCRFCQREFDSFPDAERCADNHPYMPNNYYGGAGSVPADDDRQDNWKAQREQRGFDDTELWSLDSTILRFIAPRLREFAERTRPSYPAGLTDEEWSAMLKKMAYSVEWLAENNYPIDSDDEFKRVDEGWKLFTEWFFALWT